MGVADLHDLELSWPSPYPIDVIVTGTFDQWTSSIHLVKGDTGFFGTVKVPWGQKVAYKFIVDGRWRCRDDRPQEDDGHGNTNNVLQTPEKPQTVFPAAHDPPAPLSISLEGAQSGDVEAMVTAVEFLPPTEATVVRRSLPFPIPQISVEGPSPAPSVDTPVSVSKLDTATATEGTVPPASKIPAELATFKQAPSSSDAPILPLNDNGSVSPPPANGNGEVHDSHSFASRAPIQFTKGGRPTSPSVPETAEEAVSAPLESAVPQSNRSSQGAQDTPALSDRVDPPPTPTPAAVLEPTTKRPEVDLETTVQGHRQQATASSSTGQASSSTPAPSTPTAKKRRSLFARIKYMFGKDNDKRERKEKNKH